MAETLSLPKEVKETTRWEKFVDVDYAIYGGNEEKERDYISPEDIPEKSIDKIKALKIGHKALKISA